MCGSELLTFWRSLLPPPSRLKWCTNSMHQVLKAYGISEAIIGDCMLFFPTLISADTHKIMCMLTHYFECG
jgi:hypothetical protein